MYKITKQVINSREDVISESTVAYIDCDKDTLITHLVPMYHNLAVLTNNNYKVHGLSQKIKFIAEEIIISNNIDAVVSSIRETIKNDVDCLNKYIDYLNRVLKVSNNRCNRAVNEGLINLVNVHDYMFKNIEVVAAVKDNLIIIE